MNGVGGTAHSTQAGPAVVWHSTLFLKEPHFVHEKPKVGGLVIIDTHEDDTVLAEELTSEEEAGVHH